MRKALRCASCAGKVRESFPACCRFPCRLAVGTDGHRAFVDVGRNTSDGCSRGIFEFSSECYVTALNYDILAYATYWHLHSFDPEGIYNSSGMWL